MTTEQLAEQGKKENKEANGKVEDYMKRLFDCSAEKDRLKEENQEFKDVFNKIYDLTAITITPNGTYVLKHKIRKVLKSLRKSDSVRPSKSSEGNACNPYGRDELNRVVDSHGVPENTLSDRNKIKSLRKSDDSVVDGRQNTHQRNHRKRVVASASSDSQERQKIRKYKFNKF